ncbi:hypothetical protein BX070DRAFT_255250 [Coemansia spiralis]|nr:hypothetical protein BX070DRAFT_255250 [Coemansia spiralis]
MGANSNLGVLPSSEGVQLFGLFVSPYFLFSIFIGFIISRIHVLVHRQRVRPLGILARVALYTPAHLLLLRTMVIDCVALSNSSHRQHVRPWMQTVVDLISRVAQQQGLVSSDGEIPAGRALWLSFATYCIFDCVDVFVARLEGSPCAPYEYIGGLIERTSLYYFYGGSFRIQELGLLHVLEKVLLSHVLILFENGWRWRLIPTGIANMLMLHHFLFSVRNYTGSYSVYPFVEVLSMVLLGISLVIVLATVLIRWLASTVDRLGMSTTGRQQRQRRRERAGSAEVAIYDRYGVFQGTSAEDVGDSAEMFELTQDMYIPVIPDLRRDFGLEILDLAGTCLQQYSSKIKSSGFSRPLGAMRLPRTTALDVYVDDVLRTSSASSPGIQSEQQYRLTENSDEFRNGQQRQTRVLRGLGSSGLSIFIDDEPSIFSQIPENSMDLAHALQDTRLNSVRNLSLGMWSLVVALFKYALNRKDYLNTNNIDSSADLARNDSNSAQPRQAHSWLRGNNSEWYRHDGTYLDKLCSKNQLAASGDMDNASETYGHTSYLSTDSEEDDFDYVLNSDTNSATDSISEDDGGDDNDEENIVSLTNEATSLVGDILNDTDNDHPGAWLGSVTTFMAHSLFNGDQRSLQPSMMTRGMYVQQLQRSGVSGQQHLNAPLLFDALATMFRNMSTPTEFHQSALPFDCQETEVLAQLIQSRRQTAIDQQASPASTVQSTSMDNSGVEGATSSDAALCVICWANQHAALTIVRVAVETLLGIAACMRFEEKKVLTLARTHVSAIRPRIEPMAEGGIAIRNSEATEFGINSEEITLDELATKTTTVATTSTAKVSEQKDPIVPYKDIISENPKNNQQYEQPEKGVSVAEKSTRPEISTKYTKSLPENNSSTSKAIAEEQEQKEQCWQTRTLNYDRDSPGYDNRTEGEAIAPQLKAIVGDKIGYARRQRTLEILHEHYMRIPEIASALSISPWTAAMHAVENEKHIYDNSVAGTYHGKLLSCLRELKQKANT